ncbi:hypothetical protein Tco_1356074 [Tanacetum coccineum]
MLASVASGHDGVGAGVGDPPHPPSRQIDLGVGGRKATRGGKGGDRGRRRKGVCEATKNITLRKSVEEYGSQEIKFKWNDQKMFLHVGKNHAWRSNSVVELVREFLMHYPSWLDIDKSKKAHINGGIMHHLNLRTHMRSPRWPDIEKGIEQYFAKRYSDKKHNLKRDYWNMDSDESHEYPSFISNFYDTHTRDGVWAQEEARLQYVRDDQPEGSQSRYAYWGACTEEQILAMVIKGKERGHIPGTYSQATIDDMLAERDKALAATKEEANTQKREIDLLRCVVMSDT